MSQAIDSSGGNDGNDPPGRGRGGGGGDDAQEGEGESEAIDEAFETVQRLMMQVRQEVCLTCVLTASHPDVVSQLSTDSKSRIPEIQQKFNNVMRVKYANVEATQENNRAECTNLARDEIQKSISNLIYVILPGSEADPFPQTDPYIRLLALERFRDYFGFDTQREYDCSSIF